MADRTVKVTLKGDISDFNRAMISAAAGAKTFSSSLDSSTDRMSNLVQTSLALGPALIPVGAAAVPAIAGLTNQLGFAAAGAGVAALAFSGIGDALKTVNDYALDPSVANLEQMNAAMSKLGPSGREFVTFLQDLRPRLQGLQDIAQAGLLPGVEDGIIDLMDVLPNVERVVGAISTTMGDLFAEAGDNLNDARWQEFFTFLETEARPTLLSFGRGVGNLVEGFANLWMAFDPLSDQFSNSFLEMSRDFAAWTDGLAATEGFQEFVNYIQTQGPRAWDALAAIGDALLQIVQAAAPVGAAALPVIEALADTIATIADSDIGPTVVGLIALTSALSRLKAIGTAMNSSAIGGLFGASAYGGAAKAAKELPGATRAYLQYDAAAARASMSSKDFAASTSRLGASMRGVGRLAGGAGGLAFVMSDLDDQLGLTNAAMGAMIGSALPGYGTAIGAAVGLTIDLANQTDNAAESVKAFSAAFGEQDSLAGQAAVIASMKEQIALAETIRDAGGVTGDSTADQVRTLEQGLKPLEQQHLANMRAAEDQKLAEAGLADEMRNASDQTRQETLALLDNIAAKNKAAEAALSVFNAETNYRRALKEAQEQAKKTNAGIDGSSAAALKNREMLDGLAGAWNRQAEAGGKTRAEMKKAQAAFIRVATDMGVGSKRARQLAEDLFRIPSPKPKVKVTGDEAAIRAARAVKAALDAINPFKNIVIRTTRQDRGSDAGKEARAPKADGGLLVGPGGPRDDLIPIDASNGEYIVNAAATARNLSLLNRINSQKYADGGPVAPVRFQPMSSSSAAAPIVVPAAQSIDYDRLADAVATRKIVLGSREFALAVQDANAYAGRH